MTIKSLRNTLINLPSQYDDVEIWFCLRLEEDGNRVISFDEPIHGTMLPNSTESFILLSEKAMEFMIDKNPQLKNGNNNWVEGSL